MILWLDRETYSEVDLKEVGAHQYAQTAEDLIITYAIDDGPWQAWDCTADIIPDDLEQAMVDAEEVWAHNAAFDRAVHNGPKQWHLPRIELSRWRCSMALAMSHALPGKLATLCDALNLPEDMAKLKEGKKLIDLFCKPQPSNRKIRRATRETHPDQWARFIAYAGNDIVSMREIVMNRIPKWNWDASAIAEWHLDQRINDRGFQVDRELTSAGAHAASSEKERIGVRFRELTFGVVDRPSLRAQFMEFVWDRFHVRLTDTTKDTFTLMLKNGEVVEPELKELMQLSMAANKTSTAKYAALDPAVMHDGRFRGGLQFAGASRTRRWAGRLFQPHNLPSRGLPPAEQVEHYIECLKLGTHDLFFDDLMRFGAAALRGVVIPAGGKKLAVADLSNIEGRVLAWVAGEAWKLDAFRAYDAGTGPDLYCVTAGIITGVDPWKVEKSIRNSIGKVSDLASGYGGGCAGYQNFAQAYGVKLADYWDILQQTVNPALIQKAIDNLATWGASGPADLEISTTEWLASEACKLAWRARHPATVKFWYGLGDAMKSAIRSWGTIHSVGQYIKVKGVNHAGNRWLVVRMPSGRFLTYFQPRLTTEGITYMGEASEDGKTSRHWTSVYTHGPKVTGNICQTIARDILALGMARSEELGYLPVLTVHDEIITEVPDNCDYSSKGLAEILSTNPEWALDLPLAAAGFEGYRYRKD